MAASPTEFPKRCNTCGRLISAEEWQTLRLVGTQPDPVETLELRDCSCGSTLAITVLSILDEEV